MVAKYTGPKGMGVNLELCHATAQHTLGQVVEGVTHEGRYAKFRYVQFAGATAFARGHLVNMGTAATDWVVTNVLASQMAGKVSAGVVFQQTAGLPTQNAYGWVQCAGIATILAEGALTAGMYLKTGTVAGAFAAATAGTDEEIPAQSMAVIANGNTGLAVLRIPGV